MIVQCRSSMKLSEVCRCLLPERKCTTLMQGKTMLTTLLDWRGFQLRAIDKDLGSVDDFYFDHRTWTVRYLVIDTGNWLPGRKVLIGPEAIQPIPVDEMVIPVNLTSTAIEDSPGIESDLPFSLQKERELRLFFRWREYWNDEMFIQSAAPGGANVPLPIAVTTVTQDPDNSPIEHHPNPYLRSANEVQGYAIHASDGELGQVVDFIVREGSWSIRYLVIDVGNWLIGRKVLLSPRWVSRIDWSHQAVEIEVRRVMVEQSPEYIAGEAITRDYEKRLYDHYHKPHDWE